MTTFRNNKNKKILKRVLVTLSTILVVLITLLFFAGNYFFNYALSRNGGGAKRNVKVENKSDTALNNKSELELISINKQKIAKKLENANLNNTEISLENNEGLTLIAELYKSEDNSFLSLDKSENSKSSSSNASNNDSKNTNRLKSDKTYVILLHGYHSSVDAMHKYALHYLGKGYNVLIPHMRAHGKSEGKYIGMGSKDRDDVISWINKVGELDDQANIIIHGVSMGASTAMNVSALTPASVKLIIEDCGYTSIYDIFASELDKRFSLPAFPLLDVCELITKLRAGYDFHNTNPINSLSQTKLPMLFIHGLEDDFVPYDMMEQNYNACSSEIKEKLAIPYAGHADAIYADPDLYWNSIDAFIDKVS